MPFTPFHIGPALLIFGVLTFLDPVALIYGSILVDLEPLTVVSSGLNYPLHGPVHSITGVLLLLPIFYFATILTRKIFPEVDLIFMARGEKYPASLSILSSAIGGYSHIVLDAFLYEEFNLAWPLPRWNPLLYELSSFTVYSFCIVAFMIGVPLFLLRRKISQ